MKREAHFRLPPKAFGASVFRLTSHSTIMLSLRDLQRLSISDIAKARNNIKQSQTTSNNIKQHQTIN